MKKNNQIKKIHIIGSVGSGKTTLARTLSDLTGIPYTEIDNLVWDRSGEKDVRFPREVRDRKLNDVIQQKEWILEGAQHEWTQEGFEKADLIILLNPPVWIRNYRILRRYILQKTGREQLNYKQTIHHLVQLYKWNYQFERTTRDELFEHFDRYQDKWIVMNNNKKMKGVLNEKNLITPDYNWDHRM